MSGEGRRSQAKVADCWGDAVLATGHKYARDERGPTAFVKSADHSSSHRVREIAAQRANCRIGLRPKCSWGQSLEF